MRARSFLTAARPRSFGSESRVPSKGKGTSGEWRRGGSIPPSRVSSAAWSRSAWTSSALFGRNVTSSAPSGTRIVWPTASRSGTSGWPIWALNSRILSTGTPVRSDSSHSVAPGRTVTWPTFSGTRGGAGAGRSAPEAALRVACATPSAIPRRTPSKRSVAARSRAGSPFASSSARSYAAFACSSASTPARAAARDSGLAVVVHRERRPLLLRFDRLLPRGDRPVDLLLRLLRPASASSRRLKWPQRGSPAASSRSPPPSPGASPRRRCRP